MREDKRITIRKEKRRKKSEEKKRERREIREDYFILMSSIPILISSKSKKGRHTKMFVKMSRSKIILYINIKY